MTRPVSSTSASSASSVANRAFVLGGLSLGLGAVGVATGSGVVAAIGAALGATFLWSGGVTRISSRGAETLNRAWDATSRGRLAEAEGLLDTLAAGYQLGYIRQAGDMCRARIAFRRGDLPSALRASSAAADRGLGWMGRSYVRVGRGGARALRAVVRAAMGDAAGAREDVAFVRAHPEASAEALARAELSEALLLERAGDLEALGAHLARQAPLLADFTTPRERAIVRAYERLIVARRGSVYRKAAPREPAPAPGDEPTVEDWISRISPAAASFARVGRRDPARAHAEEPTAGVDPALQRAAAARLTATPGRGRRRVGAILALWVLLIAVFLGIWQFLAPAGGTGVPEPQAPAAESPGVFLAGWLVPLFLMLVFGAVLYYRLGGADRQARRVLAAVRQAASGAREDAERALASFAKSRFPLVAARSRLELALSAERRSSFAEALEECDRGIGAASSSAEVRAVAASSLTPDLLAERAVILAATGRTDEAEAEMAHLAGAFPGYPSLARAERRFGVLRRARAGDLAAAADLAADDTCDAPIPARDELLGDLARAAAWPDATRPDEVARLERALDRDPEARRWIEAAAPAVTAAFSARGRAAGADEAAEREAQAEEEAHEPDRAPRRA